MEKQIDLSRFWIGKEVYWIVLEKNKIKIKSGKIQDLNVEEAKMVFKSKDKWYCRACINYFYHNLEYLFESRQSAVDHLNEQFCSGEF